MNWTMINWETVLVASVPGILVLAGVIYNDIRKKRNAQVDTSHATTLKREPTWVELEESNRKLRAEMEQNKKDGEERAKALEKRFDEFEVKTNARIAALSNMLHAAASQWPAEYPGPYFDPDDFAALENTDVPYIWRGRIRRANA